MMECPVCQGKGTITEDSRHYEFHTRDPKTEKCLVCNGTGVVSPNKKLPNGVAVRNVDGSGQSSGMVPCFSKKPVDEADKVDGGKRQPPNGFRESGAETTKDTKPNTGAEPQATRRDIPGRAPQIMASVTILTRPMCTIDIYDNTNHPSGLHAGWMIKQIIKAIKGE